MNGASTVQGGSLKESQQTNSKIKTILVVDDNIPLLQAIHQTLMRNGYHVLESDSPQGAIEIWDTQCENIDLVLTDVVMPGMTGLELVDIMRKKRAKVKVIVTSGFLPQILRPQIEKAGTAFLEKPFTSSALVNAVQSALAEK